MRSSRQHLQSVEGRHPPFAGKAEVKHAVPGGRHIAEDAFVGDVFSQGIRNHVEVLQYLFPIDCDRKGGKTIAFALRCNEVQMQLIYARRERNVVGKVSLPPLPEECRITGSRNIADGADPGIPAMEVFVRLPGRSSAVDLRTSRISGNQTDRHKRQTG